MARSRTKQKAAAKPARRRKRRPAARDGDAVLAVFAHDIRTALTGILALGELLASSNLGERERRWAAGIKDSAEHLASLTTLVIDAAKSRRRRRADVATGDVPAAASHRGIARNARRAGGDQRPARGGDGRGRLAGIAGRRSGAAARRAGKSHRQCGEVHRARRGAARACAAARAARGRVKLVFTVTDSGIGLKRRRDQAAVPAVRASQRRDRAPLWRRRARPRRGQAPGQG